MFALFGLQVSVWSYKKKYYIDILHSNFIQFHVSVMFLGTIFQILVEVDNLQDVPSPYLQIKGVDKEAVVAAGSMLRLDGSYTTKVSTLSLELALECLIIESFVSLNTETFADTLSAMKAYLCYQSRVIYK